ncbi:STAS domain-containing protein [Actinomycetospora lemnae]|uniref:Anti-sigma factor antagonist n=1 Tax=Actinomycetospora lemnae TaxID=3019891 RepID=A0ABT5SWG2_9PSEU|nr:STAS domain-containing protein [Actinomycetospora sp. DW7H6]MDD7967199.1 STAS domain-containing protein [Actinomycetospora sp. DW7H6]
MPELTIRTERTDGPGGQAVVVVGGDLDYDSHGRLDDAVGAALDDRPADLVVDLAEVTYCDSCGLRVLLGAHRRATEVGAAFALRGARGQPARALKLTGLDQVFS